jgi:formylglycine-generating enzyme required for sulfatase activity
MNLLPLTASTLAIEDDVMPVSVGPLMPFVRNALYTDGEMGLVVIGSFGSGKTQLCRSLAKQDTRFTSVPLRVVARYPDIESGLLAVIGSQRLDQARRGEGILLLDGFDEVPDPGPEGFLSWFDKLTSLVGPRWMLTSRPGHFRTELAADDDQVDTLSREDLITLRIDPLTPDVVRREVSALPGGSHLLASVAGLEQLSRSPLLLHAVRVALPYIEPGRPIQPWGVFDCWLKRDLDTGPDHDAVLERLVDMAWGVHRDHGFTVETTSFSADRVRQAKLPVSLSNALLVSDLDGQMRFGHRSVFEYLLATHIAPRLSLNQGQGPDQLTDLRISDATRTFVVGRVPAMEVVLTGQRARIPCGNFIAGGNRSSDERPLRIAHLSDPFWISRAPVTQGEWSEYLVQHPDERVDANYLPHWGVPRRCPSGEEELPVYGLWPEDADLYALRTLARLPTANEWEKAARGIDGKRWPWGDLWAPDKAVTAEAGVPRPLPVRAFGAQGDAALFSACGGAFEYTATDWGCRDNRGRVVMGGCYTHDHHTSRSSLRLSHKLSGRLKAGLRLAWDDG